MWDAPPAPPDPPTGSTTHQRDPRPHLQKSRTHSFLLALPAVLASGMLELTRIGQATQSPWGPTLLATGVAFTVGYAAIGWMLRYISRLSGPGDDGQVAHYDGDLI